MASVKIQVKGWHPDELAQACRELEAQFGARVQWDRAPTTDRTGEWRISGTLLVPGRRPSAPASLPIPHRRIILS